MSWLYLPAQVADYSPQHTCSNGAQSAMSSGTNTASRSSSSASKTATCTMRQSGTTLEHSTGDPGLDEWILSLRDFRASHSATRANKKPNLTREIYGLTLPVLLARYDPNTSCWKTLQASFLADISQPSMEIWPNSDMMLDGCLYRLPMSVQIICERDNGYRLPTPTANDYKGAGRKRYIGSPHYRGAKTSEALRTCKNDPIYPHPSFMEWLMGWPIGWTDLKPLAADKFQQWLAQFGDC